MGRGGGLVGFLGTTPGEEVSTLGPLFAELVFYGEYLGPGFYGFGSVHQQGFGVVQDRHNRTAHRLEQFVALVFALAWGHIYYLRCEARTSAMDYCSFCELSKDEVTLLIAGTKGVFICDECVKLCTSIVRDERREAKKKKPQSVG